MLKPLRAPTATPPFALQIGTNAMAMELGARVHVPTLEIPMGGGDLTQIHMNVLRPRNTRETHAICA